MLSLSNYQNADAALIKLLKYLHINIDAETIIAELEKHPDYPSMLAISDVLDFFNIENSAYNATFDEAKDAPCPFLAHVNTNGGGFVVVTEITDEHVTVSDDKRNHHKLKAEEFKDIFAGVALVAQPPENSTVGNTFRSFLAGIKIPAIAIVLLLIVVLAPVFYTGYLNWQALLLALFKTAGLVTSILLLIQSIDNNNPLVQVLCQNKGKANCDAILSSKAAKIPIATGIELSWSEVGFFYFAGTWLLLLFGSGTLPVLRILAVLNLVSLPYTVYSIYYQARVAKQWCVLCCTVQALLWLEFIPLSSYLNNVLFSFGGGWAEARVIFTCLVLPLIIWMLLKPLFLKLQQLQPLKQQLRAFKYNTDLFNKMLTSQPKFAIPDQEWSLVLGNVEANNIITMVTNPYCPPCAKTHKLLDELLDQNNNVQARIIFTADNTETDRKTAVSRHLMALNDLPDKTIVRQALHDWYEQKQKDYEAWAKVYPIQLNEAGFYKIDKQKAWCDMAEVTATPTMLLNGYRLPDIYQLPDLKYMLE